jgi:hypothetical protein
MTNPTHFATLRNICKRVPGYRDPEMLLDAELDGVLTKKEFILVMRAMGFTDEGILEFINDIGDTARMMCGIIDEKGGVDGALRYFGAHTKRSQRRRNLNCRVDCFCQMASTALAMLGKDVTPLRNALLP